MDITAIILRMLFLVVSSTSVNSIKCYECYEQPNDKACTLNGVLVTCNETMKSCSTLIDIHTTDAGKRKVVITKRCKQTNACYDNYKQNTKVGVCDVSYPDTHCYCCCSSDACNKWSHRCWTGFNYYEKKMGRKNSGRGPRLDDDAQQKNIKPTCPSLDDDKQFGRLDCSNKYFEGSICVLTSKNKAKKEDYNLKCEKGKHGQYRWIDPVPRRRMRARMGKNMMHSEPMRCKFIPEPSVGGTVKCTGGTSIGSQCGYSCGRGYRKAVVDDWKKKGNRDSVIMCIVKEGEPVWSGPPPVCEPIQCPPIEFDNVLCSDTSRYGSVCYLACKEGYRLEPKTSDFLVCMHEAGSNFGFWNKEQPVCEAIRCPEIPESSNLVTTCTSDRNYGSVCKSHCEGTNDVYPAESRIMICKERSGVGIWTSEFPTCRAKGCPPVNRQHFDISCSQGWSVNSTCLVGCAQPGHELHPHGMDRMTCLPDLSWSPQIPCCDVPCPTQAKLDILFLVDSSSSIMYWNWVRVRNFVVEIIQMFPSGPDGTYFGLMGFDAHVHDDEEILFKDFKDHPTPEAISETIAIMHYGGKGTATGEALLHAVEVSLHPSNGNRPDVEDIVIIITDGKANGYPSVDVGASMLRQRGTKILAVGINTKGTEDGIHLSTLVQITGHLDRVFLSRDVTEDLSSTIKHELIENICNDYHCDNSKYYSDSDSVSKYNVIH